MSRAELRAEFTRIRARVAAASPGVRAQAEQYAQMATDLYDGDGVEIADPAVMEIAVATLRVLSTLNQSRADAGVLTSDQHELTESLLIDLALALAAKSVGDLPTSS